MGSGYDSSTSAEYNAELAKGLDKMLDLIRQHGTDRDKECLRGSGMKSNRPLSETFYRRLKKAGRRKG